MRGPLGAGQPKRYMVAQVVGALLAFTVALFATGIGLDRDRALLSGRDDRYRVLLCAIRGYGLFYTHSFSSRSSP
jgi:hypothetical protein